MIRWGGQGKWGQGPVGGRRQGRAEANREAGEGGRGVRRGFAEKAMGEVGEVKRWG